VCIIIQFFSSFFVTALETEKNVPQQYAGFIASSAAVCYLITTLITGYIVHLLPKRIFIMLSFAGCTVGLFLMGPSSLLGLPNVLWIFLLGFCVLEASLGFLFVPLLPEVVESFVERYGIEEGQDEGVDGEVSDRAAALYGFFYYMGMIVSPIIGSLIYANNKSFNKTCDIFALTSLAYTVFYFFINILPDIKHLRKAKTI
jgi:MFS family permease